MVLKALSENAINQVSKINTGLGFLLSRATFDIRHLLNFAKLAKEPQGQWTKCHGTGTGTGAALHGRGKTDGAPPRPRPWTGPHEGA